MRHDCSPDTTDAWFVLSYQINQSPFFSSFPKNLLVKGGSPLERPVEAVIEDVRDGYVSLEQAKRDYGVELAQDTLEVVRLAPERSRFL